MLTNPTQSSEASITGSTPNSTLMEALKIKASKLEMTALEANHSLKMSKEAIKNNKPPKDLIPTQIHCIQSTEIHLQATTS